MARPTIRDLAEAADVSVSTVNRVLGGSAKVRKATMERVLEAAERIEFYGVGAIERRVSDARPVHRLSVLLLQGQRLWYQALADRLRAAAKAVTDADVQLRIVHLDDLSPDHVAARMREVGSESDALAVVAAQHPHVTAAIETLAEKGVPVCGLISPLSAPGTAHYVGLDNWKVGRTAAWAFHHICKAPGKIGLLVGSHRYRNQELNESGFRSYFREYGTDFQLLEPLSTFESGAVAHEMVERLLAENEDLCGLFVSGGGITGALTALRDSGRAGQIVTVGYELMEVTRAALLDGSMTFVISHPLDLMARETIAAMIRARTSGGAGSQRVLLPFEIYTRENL